MARARRKPAPSRTRTSAAQRAARARRAKIVWGSLLGSMTMVGGLLLMLDSNPAPRVGGRTLALVAANSAATFDTLVFQPIVPIKPTQWTGIVIHHSGSVRGTEESIEAEHVARNIRGLGHHFLIGNGNGLSDGQIHIGYRWSDQLPGAHAGGALGQAHNLHSISICLVGDGNRRPFTKVQMEQLVRLVSALCRELGIPADKVVLHSDIATTDDPGRLFPVADFRAAVNAAR